MTPIFQDKFDGNCLAACLASIFEIRLDAVPFFGTDDKWFDRFSDWMITYFQLYPIDIEVPSVFVPKGYHLINGLSRNGDYWHAVVGKDGEIVHDPHPDGNALKEPKTFTIFASVIGDE